MIIALILTACTQENSNEGILNVSDEWSAKLINQPPVILFDYDKNDNKDRFAFDYVLYDMQLQERKRNTFVQCHITRAAEVYISAKTELVLCLQAQAGKGLQMLIW